MTRSIAQLDAAGLQAFASELQSHLIVDTAGRLQMRRDSIATVFGREYTSEIDSAISTINGLAESGFLKIGEDLSIEIAARATKSLSAAEQVDWPSKEPERLTGWMDLDGTQTGQVMGILILGAAAAVIVTLLLAVISVAVFVVAGPLGVVPAVLAALALYLAVNAVALVVKLGQARTASGVRLRFVVRNDSLWSVFIVHHIDVESR